MKRIWLMIAVFGIACTSAYAQTSEGMVVDKTHIPVPSNATYQNHAQFYNKDNHSLPHRKAVMTTGNGTYWEPGYSNEANRQPYTDGLGPGTSVGGANNGNSYYNSTLINTINGTINMNKTTPSNINTNTNRR